jgi:hypothetical protein
LRRLSHALPAQFFETRANYRKIVGGPGACHDSSVDRRELLPVLLTIRSSPPTG